MQDASGTEAPPVLFQSTLKRQWGMSAQHHSLGPHHEHGDDLLALLECVLGLRAARLALLVPAAAAAAAVHGMKIG
jgi:hypothetical protein